MKDAQRAAAESVVRNFVMSGFRAFETEVGEALRERSRRLLGGGAAADRDRLDRVAPNEEILVR